MIASVAGKGMQLKRIHNDIGHILSNINHSFVFDRQGETFRHFSAGQTEKNTLSKETVAKAENFIKKELRAAVIFQG